MKVIGYSIYAKESNGRKYVNYYVNCSYEIPKEKGKGVAFKQYCIPQETLDREGLKSIDSIYLKDCEFYYNESFNSNFKTVGSIKING